MFCKKGTEVSWVAFGYKGFEPNFPLQSGLIDAILRTKLTMQITGSLKMFSLEAKLSQLTGAGTPTRAPSGSPQQILHWWCITKGYLPSYWCQNRYKILMRKEQIENVEASYREQFQLDFCKCNFCFTVHFVENGVNTRYELCLFNILADVFDDINRIQWPLWKNFS